MLFFDIEKCKVMHCGINMKLQYFMNGRPLVTTDIEKDLGVHVSSNLKVGNHVKEMIKKVNLMLGVIKHSFTY